MNEWFDILSLLARYAVLSIVVERALYVVFEWKAFIKLEGVLEDRFGLWFDVKPPISIAVGVMLAFTLQADLLAGLFAGVAESPAGYIVTGLYLAGGSKAAFLAFRRLREIRDAKATAEIEKAEAEVLLG